MTSIAHQLLGQTRSAVLSALLLHPESSLHVRELARLTGASAGSLHRELRMLAGLGLLTRQEVGRQVHCRANETSPVFPELVGLLRRTAGIADLVRDALAPLGRKVELAFVFGSVAVGAERATSDVDVMVLGPAGFGDVVRADACASGAAPRGQPDGHDHARLRAALGIRRWLCTQRRQGRATVAEGRRR